MNAETLKLKPSVKIIVLTSKRSVTPTFLYPRKLTTQCRLLLTKNDSMYNQLSNSFECVGAWQKAHAFTLLVYRLTCEFPKDEIFGLTSQFRRAAVSIEANFAEGYKKISKADKLRFFNISEGSLAECHNYIILAKDLGYVDEQQNELLLASLKEASKLLTSYCKGIINNNGIQEELLNS